MSGSNEYMFYEHEYTTVINNFKVKFDGAEGWWWASYYEPKTKKWDFLRKILGDLDYAVKEITEEISEWDGDDNVFVD